MDASTRFFSKVVESPDGCWLWSAATRQGYGAFWFQGRHVPAHRWCYEHLRSDVPGELFLDHLCRNRACVNPWHLEPVTQQVNLLRAPGTFQAQNAAKTHCTQGHPFDTENTYTPPGGGRHCRKCRIQATARQRQKHGRQGTKANPRETQVHNPDKTHCPQGHPYDEANTYRRKDRRGRDCRQCKRDRDRRK